LIYFFKYDIAGSNWQGNYTLFNMFAGAMQILAMMLFFPLLRKAFSTLKIFYIGVIAAIAGYLILLGLSIAGTKNVYVFFVPGFFIMGAVGILNVIVTIFLANTVDYGELKNRRRDELLVALAGVVMNLLLAALFTVVAKVYVMAVGVDWVSGNTIGMGIWEILIYIIQINLVLMIFNLIPCPPLDGFNIIANVFGFGGTQTYWNIYRYGNWILVLIIVFGVTGMVISPCIQFLMNIVWGILF
jgi:Zn-dependent protease